MEKIVESLQDVFFLGLGKNSLPFYHLVRLSRSRMIFFWRFFLELESLPSPHRNRRFESRETSNSKPDDATRTDTKWNQGWAGVSERWVWPVWPVIHDKTGYDTMSIFIIIYIYIYIYMYMLHVIFLTGCSISEASAASLGRLDSVQDDSWFVGLLLHSCLEVA